MEYPHYPEYHLYFTVKRLFCKVENTIFNEKFKIIFSINAARDALNVKTDRFHDNMGMLATVMNSLALCEALEQLGVKARVMSAVGMQPIAEQYVARDAVAHLNDGEVVIFGCGTGCPFFSTDTTAALRAAEIEADVIFKATNVDGVFDKDPNKFDDAVKYDTLTHSEVLAKGLKVMDSTAASLCRDNSIAILVFNLEDPENIIRAVKGENIGTLVKE